MGIRRHRKRRKVQAEGKANREVSPNLSCIWGADAEAKLDLFESNVYDK